MPLCLSVTVHQKESEAEFLQLVTQFPTLYGTRRSVTVFTKAELVHGGDVCKYMK